MHLFPIIGKEIPNKSIISTQNTLIARVISGFMRLERKGQGSSLDLETMVSRALSHIWILC